jgi:glycosyltransferase involved in cell wall biosynthesis
VSVLRVLEIHQSHGIYGSDKVFEDVSSGLRETGFEVRQFSLDDRETQRDDLRYFLWTTRLNFFQNIFSLKIASALTQYITEVKPDIIHFHTIDASILGFGIPIFYGKMKGAKVVKTQHDWGMVCTNDWHVKSRELCNQAIELSCGECYVKRSEFLKHYFAKKWLRNPIYKVLADVITVPSIALRDDMIKFGFRNVRHIYNFVELSSPNQRETPPAGNTLIFIGRLVKSKGLDELISAFFLVKKVVYDAELHVVGRGSPDEISYVTKLIAEHDLQESVFIHANASNEEKTRLLSSSKLCLMPSVWKESFGLVILEAFASGVPVVAFKIGALPEIIQDDRTLAEWRNVNELAEKTIRILTDEDLRQEMIRNNTSKLHLFDKKEIIGQWVALFKSLKETNGSMFTGK